MTELSSESNTGPLGLEISTLTHYIQPYREYSKKIYTTLL